MALYAGVRQTVQGDSGFQIEHLEECCLLRSRSLGEGQG